MLPNHMKHKFPDVLHVTVAGLKAIGSGADTLCSGQGPLDRQGFFSGIEATRGSRGSSQALAALAREADEV